MKTIKFKSALVLLFLVIFIPIKMQAQNYSTQEGYENYFIKNFDQLDPIEGIWTKRMNYKFADPKMPTIPETEVTVAIIFEGQDNSGNKIFGEYYLTNGRYDPTRAKCKYLKFKDLPTKYLNTGVKNEEFQGKIVYSSFYIRTRTDNIEYTVKMTEKGTSKVLNGSINMFKAFPFEGDVK
jgi:hypothetical protein